MTAAAFLAITSALREHSVPMLLLFQPCFTQKKTVQNVRYLIALKNITLD